MAVQYGNQAERVVQEAQARACQIAPPSEEQTNRVVREAARYTVEKNFEDVGSLLRPGCGSYR
jgi:isocitrate dehydrogenase